MSPVTVISTTEPMLRTACDCQQQVITTELMQMTAWAYLTVTMVIKVRNHYYLGINLTQTKHATTGISP